MVDAHKAYQGLKHCVEFKCQQCPYQSDDYIDGNACISRMQKDVLKVLIELIGQRRLDTEVEHETD